MISPDESTTKDPPSKTNSSCPPTIFKYIIGTFNFLAFSITCFLRELVLLMSNGEALIFTIKEAPALT